MHVYDLTLKVIQAGLAHEFGKAIDLGTARAAFSSLAVPAHGQVTIDVRLNPVHRIEHNHAFDGRYLILLLHASVAVAAEDPKRKLGDVSHLLCLF
jgi:hypothetical protein